MPAQKHIVIVGGGFGGLSAATTLANSDVDVTLVDKTNYHLFQPLLYQVATAALAPGEIAQPLRSILRTAKNVHVQMTEVVRVDTATNTLVTDDGDIVYDELILAPGARHGYFGHPEWEDIAPGIKDISDAIIIRERLLATFEDAERYAGTEEARSRLTFIVVGAGPTGVELAGAIAEISRRTMLPDFPRLRAEDIRVILVEGGSRILASFHPKLSERALRDVQSLGVEVHLNTFVKNVTEDGAQLGDVFVGSNNVIWAAGNVASPILASLNTPLDNAGRAIVTENCNVPNHPNVYVIGDAANCTNSKGELLPGVAQVAMQQGKYVAKNILQTVRASKQGKQPKMLVPFVYRDLGSMATIGRAKAIADINGYRFVGIIAWAMWAGLHVVSLISFRSRLKVLIEWLWFYISFQPGARLIVRVRDNRTDMK